MDVKINIEPDQINKFVADSIIQSTLGVQLQKIIKDKVDEYSRQWDNPLKKAVEYEIERVIAIVLRDEYGDQIRSHIKDLLAKMITDEFCNNLLNDSIMKFIDRRK